MLILTYTAYDNDRRQNFTATKDGIVIGYAQEGIEATLGGMIFTIEDEGRPFRIGDRFEITDEGVSTFIPIRTNLFMGFGQTFTHALRETSIDTSSSYAISAYREWEVNMGYRAGGLVATDDLQVYTANETLSESAYSLLFKKNPFAQNEWVQALRISVTQIGTADVQGTGFVPSTDGADWIFRIEGYNPRYLGISYFVLDAANELTFYALSKAHTSLEWKQRITITDVVTTELPLTITGIQNVVNFLFGYSKYLELQGWEFNKLHEFNNDAETGRTRSFQLEIEKFVDRCYAGIEVGQGQIINPFIDRVTFNQRTGLLSEFIDTSLFDVSGHPGVYDALGVRYQKSDLDIVRTNAQSSFGASGPMFSAHVQLDDFEHIFIFNNFSQPSTGSGMLYDPFSGGRVVTYRFNGRKQASQTMRPEFGGHFLANHEVHQNLQASTDNVANFYDSNHAFENGQSSKHAFSLLGFSTKEYFDNIDISNKTQFNFWRGLIQLKGTNLSIDAYLNNNRFDDAKIDEYWAYKVAQYGDARQKIFPELKIQVQDALTQFTQLQFDPAEEDKLPGFTYIYKFDESRWFSIDDMNQDAYFNAEIVGTFVKSDAVIGTLYTLPFVSDKLVGTGFTPINATTVVATGPVAITGYGPARPRFNPIKLFNFVYNELIEEIPLWHPAAGQHAPMALENINIISDLNPARYNYSTQILNNSLYDPLRPWGANEVGRTWFDTRNLSYLPYYDAAIFPSLDERLSRWGTLADSSTIDVYEWVQSTVAPIEYNALAAAQVRDASLDVFTKAAGEVADQQTYVRNRLWAIRPIAWSFSSVPVDVDWGGTPPFPGGSFSTRLFFETNGTASLEFNTFEALGMIPGMRIGAWDSSDANPKPISEYIIEDSFTRSIIDTTTGSLATEISTTESLPITIEVSSIGDSDISGPLLFTEVPVEITQRINLDGSEIPEWDVNVLLRVLQVDTGAQEYVSITSTIGTAGPISYAPANPGQPAMAAVAGQEFIPAHPGQPYIAHVEGQEFIPARTEQPYLAPIEGQPFIPADIGQSGYQVVRFGPKKVSTSLTSLDAGNTYTASIAFNGGAPITLSIAGASAGTFDALVAQLNAQLPGAPVDLLDGDLVFMSSTRGPTSTVSIIDTNLFSSMTDFDSIQPAVPGTAPTAGQPYIEAFAGQVHVAAHPGQPYIAHVEGQEFIPAHPGQPYIAEVIEQEYTPPTAEQQAVPAEYLNGATITVSTDELLIIDLPGFELRLSIQVNEGGTYPADALRNAIVSALSNRLSTRNAVQVTPIVPNPSSVVSPLSNDPLAPENAVSNGFGWRTWSVPTQAQLDLDGQQPFSSWKPYVGDFTPITGSLIEIQDAVQYAKNPLTLNNGTVIERYESTWTDWELLKNVVLKFIQTVTGPVVFDLLDNFDPIRTSVYVNGIAQLKASFNIVGKTLTVAHVPVGSIVTVIIRKYEPTATELNFIIFNDLSIQQQYKQDYEYVSIPVRDAEGALSSTLYYFWVKNKTTPAIGKKLSVQAIAQILRTGPSNFLTFQNLIGDSASTFRYNAITVSGLSYIITKDDTFKLRFTRNFTLRDDPEELNLKNVHTEWSLMRPAQKTRVPEALWRKLTDSVAGADIAGNAVPALRRVLYDERNESTTRFGFGPEQTLAPAELLKSSITSTIINTKLIDASGTIPVPDYITVLNLDESETWFTDSATSRKTMTDIWNQGKISQVNEIFFSALNDILASNIALSDIYKTSRLSAYSIKIIQPASNV